jgi:hypothetical protein
MTSSGSGRADGSPYAVSIRNAIQAAGGLGIGGHDAHHLGATVTLAS